MAGRGTVDQSTIVAAARRLLEAEGVAALSMRRLATDLDSKPMTLYHHVPSKAVLLGLVLSEVAAEIPWTDPVGAPEERMVEIVMDMVARLEALPWLVPVLREGTTVGLPALVLADRFLSAALEAGADELGAMSLWRSVWWLASSEIMFAATVAARDDGATSWYEKIHVDDLPDVPTVRALLPRWRDLSSRYDLREAVTAQVRGAVATWTSA